MTRTKRDRVAGVTADGPPNADIPPSISCVFGCNSRCPFGASLRGARVKRKALDEPLFLGRTVLSLGRTGTSMIEDFFPRPFLLLGFPHLDEHDEAESWERPPVTILTERRMTVSTFSRTKSKKEGITKKLPGHGPPGPGSSVGLRRKTPSRKRKDAGRGSVELEIEKRSYRERTDHHQETGSLFPETSRYPFPPSPALVRPFAVRNALSRVMTQSPVLFSSSSGK